MTTIIKHPTASAHPPRGDNPPRPLSKNEQQPAHQAPSVETAYMVMSVQALEAPWLDNLLAAIFSWITLAGFIILPGTFTSLETSDRLGNTTGGKLVQDAVKNIPILVVGVGFCVLGTIGSLRLWQKWRQNYIWLMMHIFM